MSEKKSAVPAAAAAPETPAAEPKKRKSSGAAQRRGRPPLSPEVYVEFGTNQYNITDVIERAKADYRATHKVGVQSCKVYVKPEEGMAYYVINKVSGKLELCCSSTRTKASAQSFVQTPFLFYKPYSSVYFRVRYWI